jgi:hypothetical protein
MKKFWFDIGKHGGGLLLRLVCLLLAAFFCVGCHIFPPMPNVVKDMGPRYRPTNVYRAASVLPPGVRRVALLPIAMHGTGAFLQAGVENLTPLVAAELAKTKRFEVIPVSPEDLRQLSGKIAWRPDEPLPANFFRRLSEATGCDAVMFCELTRYAPYQPLAVGWKFSLVETLTGDLADAKATHGPIIWAADEVLDAGDGAVSNAARDYYEQHLRNEAPSADATTILSSPTRFGQYTLAALLETIPGRAILAAK